MGTEFINESGDLVVVNKAGAEFVIVEGGRYVLRANGAVQDSVTSKFVAVRPSGERFKNRENASESSIKRWQGARAAAAEGLAAAVAERGGVPAAGAWAAVVAAMASKALDGKGFESVKAAEFVGKAAAVYSDRPEAVDKLINDMTGGAPGASQGGLLDGLAVESVRLVLAAAVSVKLKGQNDDSDGV